MEKGLKLFERIIIYALLAMMAIVILLATIDLGRLIVLDIITSATYLLSVNQLLEIFGFILLIIIGVELFETIKAYLVEHVVHIEIVLEVALIAIARKVIILDVKELSPGTLYGIAGVVLALSVGYYLERRARRMGKWIESKLEQ
jgi:uncharacterized membrane protein (DUF373 family)